MISTWYLLLSRFIRSFIFIYGKCQGILIHQHRTRNAKIPLRPPKLQIIYIFKIRKCILLTYYQKHKENLAEMTVKRFIKISGIQDDSRYFWEIVSCKIYFLILNMFELHISHFQILISIFRFFVWLLSIRPLCFLEI